jgi:hypothetical protein
MPGELKGLTNSCKWWRSCYQRRSVGIRNDVKVQGALTWRHFWQLSRSNSELTISNEPPKREYDFRSGLCPNPSAEHAISRVAKHTDRVSEIGRYNTKAYRTSVNKNRARLFTAKVFQP